MGGELGQQAFGAVLGGGAEEYGLELQPAADGFFQNAHAFDGAVAVGREFAMREGCAQLFDQGVVASLDASQAAVDSRVVSGCGPSFTAVLGRIIRVYLSLAVLSRGMLAFADSEHCREGSVCARKFSR